MWRGVGHILLILWFMISHLLCGGHLRIINWPHFPPIIALDLIWYLLPHLHYSFSCINKGTSKAFVRTSKSKHRYKKHDLKVIYELPMAAIGGFYIIKKKIERFLSIWIVSIIVFLHNWGKYLEFCLSFL